MDSLVWSVGCEFGVDVGWFGVWILWCMMLRLRCDLICGVWV